MNNKTEMIRILNNKFRRSFIGGKIMLSLGIRTKPAEEVAEILERVRTFNNFTPDNDPYSESDMGSFDCKGDKIFFKIDYYSPDMRYASEDPADPNKTVRILSIFRACEY